MSVANPSPISKGFIYCSAVLFIISIFSSGGTALQSRIVAYTTLAMGVILTSLPIFNAALKSASTINFNTLKGLAESTGSSILWLVIIACLIALTAVYRPQISSGAISSNYTNYANLSSLLFLFSIWLTTSKTVNGELPKKYNYVSLLANVLNGVCVIILYITLTYQTTDG